MVVLPDKALSFLVGTRLSIDHVTCAEDRSGIPLAGQPGQSVESPPPHGRPVEQEKQWYWSWWWHRGWQPCEDWR